MVAHCPLPVYVQRLVSRTAIRAGARERNRSGIPGCQLSIRRQDALPQSNRHPIPTPMVSMHGCYESIRTPNKPHTNLNNKPCTPQHSDFQPSLQSIPTNYATNSPRADQTDSSHASNGSNTRTRRYNRHSHLWVPYRQRIRKRHGKGWRKDTRRNSLRVS